MNIRRMVPIAAALTAIAAAAVLATATGVHAQRLTPAVASTHNAASTAQMVLDRDPSIPDASMALRGRPDRRWEPQPETF
jgi:hypothetical protein